MKIVNPATGAVIADIAADNAAAVRRKYEAARAGQRPLGEGADQEAARSHRQVPRADRRDARDARAHADARGGQAHPPIAQRAHRPPRADRLLPGRVRARAARGKGPRRRQAEDGRADHARAARRRRQHLGVELSVLRRRQRVRPRADRRQRRAVQAVGVRDAHGPFDRGDAARSGHSARRVRPGRRRRRDRRRADAPAGRRRVLHRFLSPPGRRSPPPRAGG